MATTDFFIKIDGIAGESTDSKHSGEIDVQSWSWKQAQGGSLSGGGSGAGKVVVGDFEFVAATSKASPTLFVNCASGAHIKTALFTARKAGGQQQEYLKFTLTDVVVSSFHMAAGGEAGVLPSETVSLKFASIKMEYSPQKADGSLGSPVITGWNVTQNTKL